MKKILTLFLVIIAIISGSSMLNAQALDKLPRSTPEAEGVSSAGIIDFLNAVDTAKFVEVHSFMIIRHGKVISEGWWNPYGPDYKHMMASVSKTFTATAVGLAASENKLKITDKVISFFPYSLPDTIGENMKALEIKDLLSMSVGQEPAPGFRGTDWIRTFIGTEPIHKPGSEFLYNNMATFMLSAIVQQATGQTVFDYLTPRIFEPLGLKGIDWDLSPQGINIGAAGLRLRTEDMAKFGQLLLQNGNWKGKQLIPAAWVKEATSFKIESKDPGNKRPKESNDWAQGYCYQMWRGRYNTVRFDGARGQWGILIPDKDAVVILTSNSSVTQRELDLVWKFLLPAMKDVKSLAADSKSTQDLSQKIAGLKLNGGETGNAHSKLESAINGKEFKLDVNTAGLESVSFNFNNTGKSRVAITKNGATSSVVMSAGAWTLSNSDITTLLPLPAATSPLSMNGSKSTGAKYQANPLHKVSAMYTWVNDNTLEVTSRFLEDSFGAETLVYKFYESQGSISISIERKATTAVNAVPSLITGRLARAR
jgi:CubicO group peptidase (beta-lactamase class C family)